MGTETPARRPAALYPKRSLFLIAFGHLAIELSNQSLPVVYPLLLSDWGLSYTHVGAVALVAGITASLLQPLFGYLSDRWSSHRVTALSVGLTGLAIGMVGFVQDYPLLLVLVILGNIGVAAFHPPGATIAAASGWGGRGLAVSLFSVGGSLGAALSPLFVAAGMRWLGMRGTAAIIPVALLGSLALGHQLGRGMRTTKHELSSRDVRSNNGSMLGLVLIIVAVLFRTWCDTSFRTYLPTWVQSQGGSIASGGQLLSVYTLFVGVGSLAGGMISDRIGRWRVLAVSLGIIGPAVWLVLGSTGVAQVALAGLMGAASGATFPVSIVIAQECWPGRLGVAAGLIMGIPWVASGLGAFATGLLADRYSLDLALRSLAVPGLLGAAFTLPYPALRYLLARRGAAKSTPDASTCREAADR